MKIILTIVDAPAGHNPHEMLRTIAREAQYYAASVKSVSFTDTGAQIDMEPRKAEQPGIVAGCDLQSVAATKAT